MNHPFWIGIKRYLRRIGIKRYLRKIQEEAEGEEE